MTLGLNLVWGGIFGAAVEHFCSVYRSVNGAPQRSSQRVYVLLKTPHSAQLSRRFLANLGFSGEYGRRLQRAVMADTLR